RVPEKSGGLLRAGAPVAARCAVIDAEKANYKIAWMCRLLGVPRSSFYAWRNKVETATAARRRELAAQVRRGFEAGRGAYGGRRVPAGRGPAEPGRASVQRRPGRGPDARAGPARLPAPGLQAHHGARGAAAGQPGPDRPGLHRGSARAAPGR